MVGISPHGELTSVAATTRGGLRFSVATATDDIAIRRLLRETPTRGAISLSFEREPDYARGTHLAGADDATIVAYEHDRLICMGRCTTRPCWVNGRIQPVSYLAELRLSAPAQGRFEILRGGYRFFRELRRTEPAAFTFTSIAADNHRARQLLERGLRGMPRYEFLTEFTTLLLPVTKQKRPALPLEVAPAAEIADFLNAGAGRNQFGAAWSAERIAALARLGLPIEQIGVFRRDGRIAACAGLWDQRSFRQVVIRAYSGPLAHGRSLINRIGPWFGIPKLPDPGSVLAQAFLSPLAIAPEQDSMLPDLVGAAAARAAESGLEFLTLGFPADHSHLTLLRRHFRCHAYASRLYRVHWPGDPAPPLDSRPIMPDVSLL